AFQEARVETRLARELGVEADDEHVPLLGGHRMAVDLGEDRPVVAGLGDPRRADEDRAHRPAVHAGEVEVGLERADLAAERVAPRDDVHDAQVVAVEHDQPGARAEDRGPGGRELAQRLGEALALDAQRHRRGLAARDDQPVEPLEAGRRAHLARVRAELAQDLRVRLEVALEGEDADDRRHHPRGESSCSVSSLRASSEIMGAPSPSVALATRSGSLKCVVASTMARARGAGSSDLKIPEPTKTASAPSCMTSEASAGVAIPPAQNSGTGNRPSWATARTMS